MKLSKEHKEKLAHYFNIYRRRLEEELSEGEWDKERKNRTAFYRRVFARENLEKLTEAEFGEAIRQLWASQIWTNKDYLVDKIIKKNGMERIRSSFRILLYGKESVQDRFNLFSDSIKGLGPSSITEILSFVSPKEYGIWNDKPKNALPFLGMKNLLPEKVFKYQLDGKDYRLCNEVLKLIGREMEGHGFKDVDLLDVDIFMWLLFSEVVKKESKPEKANGKVVDPAVNELRTDPRKLGHWDTMGILLELGNLLGFETYTADPSRRSDTLDKHLGDIAVLKEIPPFTYQRHLDTVKNVDVIWFKEEFPAFCFEVEHTTGVTNGLLRLYQIRNFTDAKLFIVAPSEIITRFQSEITKDPFYKIRSRYSFKSYDELVEFFEEARKYYELENRFIGSP